MLSEKIKNPYNDEYKTKAIINACRHLL
jgi:hypothetical protein